MWDCPYPSLDPKVQYNLMQMMQAISKGTTKKIQYIINGHFPPTLPLHRQSRWIIFFHVVFVIIVVKTSKAVYLIHPAINDKVHIDKSNFLFMISFECTATLWVKYINHFLYLNGLWHNSVFEFYCGQIKLFSLVVVM